MLGKRFLTADEITRLRSLAHYTMLHGSGPTPKVAVDQTIFVYEHLGITLPIGYHWIGNEVVLNCKTVQWQALIVLSLGPYFRTKRDHLGRQFKEMIRHDTLPMYHLVQQEIEVSRRNPKTPDWCPAFSDSISLWAVNFGKLIKRDDVELSNQFFPDDLRLQVKGDLKAFERDLVLMVMDEDLMACRGIRVQ
jgi:hypothetical protein